MIDAVKDYLAWKRFGIVAYICIILHLLCGTAFIAVTGALRASENGKFSCSVDPKSTATYKKHVDQSCFSIGGPIQCVVSYRDQCAHKHTNMSLY